MAEIKIEKKKPIWPWILAGLIVAAILYFFVFGNEDDNQLVDTTTEQITEEDTTNRYETSRTTAEIAAVQEYITYIKEPDMGVNHEYSNGAIKKLIAAVEAKAQEGNVDIDADLSKAKQRANEITKDPNRLAHADMIKEAGEIITRAMKTIQTKNFPNRDREISEVESALQNIKTKQPTLEQKDAVKNFFSKAGDALTSMK